MNPDDSQELRSGTQGPGSCRDTICEHRHVRTGAEWRVLVVDDIAPRPAVAGPSTGHRA